MTIENGASICGLPISGSLCLGNLDTTQNLLEVVAVNASNVSPAWSMTGAGTYEGIAFMNGVFNGANGSSMDGPVIADTGERCRARGRCRARSLRPPGAPGAAATSTSTTTTSGPAVASWVSVPGSWEQLK